MAVVSLVLPIVLIGLCLVPRATCLGGDPVTDEQVGSDHLPAGDMSKYLEQHV